MKGLIVTMTRTDLFEAFLETHGDKFQSKTAAKTAFDGVFELMRDQLAAGNELTITGFGKFKLTKLNEREVKNPRTKQVTVSPAHTVVRFTPGRPLAKSVK